MLELSCSYILENIGMMRAKYLEKIIKGASNHRRIEIIDVLDKLPQQTAMQLSERLNVNYKTLSEHLRRLAHAGLVEKNYRGAEVQHTLTDLGETILKFLRILE